MDDGILLAPCKAAPASMDLLEEDMLAGMLVGMLMDSKKAFARSVAGTMEGKMVHKVVGKAERMMAHKVPSMRAGMEEGKVCKAARKRVPHSSICYRSIPTRKVPSY